MSALWAFVESVPSSGEVELSADESRHVTARRLRSGDSLVVFDGRGTTATARLVEARKKAARVEIEVADAAPRSVMGPVIASAIPKGDRLSTMLQMLTQLGAPVWQPLVFDHSVVRRLDPDGARIQRILVESAKLARRPWLLEVRPVVGLGALLGELQDGATYHGDREGSPGPLPSECGRVVIGPEAGFTDLEREDLERAGSRPASFAPHNLRIETAAIAAMVNGFAGRASAAGEEA